MDVERIQKINNLALDLMKQGLATTREDAIQQAEKIFHGQAAEYSEFREQAENKPEQREAAPELSADDVRSILEQNSKFLVKQIKGFQEQMAALQQKMKELQQKVDSVKIPTVRDLVSEVKRPEPQQAPQQQQHSQVTAGNKDVPANHPRSGGYNDTDVSIEKFFYMGSK